MNIFEVYWHYAAPVVVLHGFLLLTCMACLVTEFRLLRFERRAFNGLVATEFGVLSPAESEVVAITELSRALSRNGEMPGLDMIRSRLLTSLQRYEVLVRICLNAFVISGLLGTLFNLWKISPSFWSELVKGSTESGQPAIGIAFAASLFGLGTALAISLIDGFVIRHPRQRFVGEAANRIYLEATRVLPPREGAAVAEALRSFYDASEGFLTQLRTEHNELSTQFTTQIRDSSQQLNATIEDVSGNWARLTENVSGRLTDVADQVNLGIQGLTGVTTETRDALALALPALHDVRDLSVTLLTLRSHADDVRAQLDSQLREHNNQWRTELQSITESQIERLENSYTEGLSRYEVAAGNWQSATSDTIQAFTQTLSNSIAQLETERQQTRQQVEALITSWRGELGRAATGVGAGLANLNAEVEGLNNTSIRLSQSYANAQGHIHALQQSLTTFNADVIRGTPLGVAVGEMVQALNKFVALVHQQTMHDNSGFTPNYGNDIDSILSELRNILSAIKALNGSSSFEDIVHRSPGEYRYADTGERMHSFVDVPPIVPEPLNNFEPPVVRAPSTVNESSNVNERTDVDRLPNVNAVPNFNKPPELDERPNVHQIPIVRTFPDVHVLQNENERSVTLFRKILRYFGRGAK